MATLGKALEFDESKLNAFVQKAVGDMGAALHATLVVIGDKLGLYKAMSGAGWMTAAELAAKTSTAERYVREWLNANATSEYVAVHFYQFVRAHESPGLILIPDTRTVSQAMEDLLTAWDWAHP